MDTGSSASSTVGRAASARANATRWRWPPDSSCGYLTRKCFAGVSRTCSIRAATSVSVFAPLPWCSFSGRSR